jgi:putative endonuclease
VIERGAVGRAGEELAVRHLERVGYTVADRNVRFRGGEIDVVARLGSETVFIEVKSRVGDIHTEADSRVDRAKLRRLERLGSQYMLSRRADQMPWRIDVIAVIMRRDLSLVRLDHIEGASYS